MVPRMLESSLSVEKQLSIMATVYISVGSNIEREKYIRAGIKALTSHYGTITCSPIYESIAVGFEGDNFYNLVVAFETDESCETVDTHLSKIEDLNGRDRSSAKFSARTLDLDLLLYDDLVLNSKELTLPRPEIYENAFVLQPLADIAHDLVDPKTHRPFGELWAEFDKLKQKLWVVDLEV